MVAWIVEQHQAICVVLAKDRKHWNKLPSENKFANLEDMLKVLELLLKFTDALAGEKHVTISAVCPLLDHILKTIVDVKPSDTPIVKEMKEKVMRISEIITADLQKLY